MRRFRIGALLERTATGATARPVLALLALVPLAAVCVAIAVLTRTIWRRGESRSSELTPAEPYAIAVRSERADFDLNFGEKTRYILIIGSLAPSERSIGVECSSGRVPVVQSAPLERVSPLDPLERPSSVGGGERDIARQARSAETDLNVRNSADASSAVTKGAGSPSRPASASGSRSFSLHVTDGSLDDPSQYATVHAKTIANGRQVRVYLDDQQSPSELPPGLVQEVIDLFDGDIIPRFRGLLGMYRDVDHDGRFAVLLSPWLSRLQGGRTSVGGFVRGSDFQACLDLPFSNRCDMMYVNSQTLPGAHLRTLLIHEYTHAVCFSRRTGDPCGRPRFPEEEDWLNEAMAHCAESLFRGGWSNLDYRIARFLNDPSAFPLVVGDYYRAGLWRCHGCRGATYLFLRYCLERFGPEVLTRLVANPAHGIHNIELATGCSFDRLFRGWTLWLIDTARRSGQSAPFQPVLAPLDLYGALGKWGLAGPRRQVWNVDAAPPHIELKGTSALSLELCASGSPGPRRLSLEGAPGSALQLSVVRLEDNSPRIEVAAAPAGNWASASATSKQATGEKPPDARLHVNVHCVGNEDLTIEQIAVEQNLAETHASNCFSGASLFELRSDRLAKPDDACHTFDLPAGRLSACDVPIVVKVVAVDRRGRRTAAWAVVPFRAAPKPERLAQRIL